MSYLQFFRQKLCKAIVIFEINFLKLVELPNFVQKFGTKNALFGYFWAASLK